MGVGSGTFGSALTYKGKRRRRRFRERWDRLGMGAHAVARDAACGVGGVEETKRMW